jgi:hypothetical protein
VVADELGHPVGSPGRLGCWGDTSVGGSITVAKDPCVHRPSS